ncbi:MAG: BREX system P-loop protein BrxC [Butyrivibrio sp.]|nr:BREX system P-loop protein BrxC [Butyrivibrio sp.]
MRIEKMFAKDINRPITGVIKVGQIEEKNKEEELKEYVVTRELSRHFRTFFSNYTASIQNPTDEMGVWISGFFGSGKSHFLKVLSYILDNVEVGGKNAAAYFEDKDTISSDGITMGNIALAARTKTQAILFNVDSKATATGKSDSNAIVLVFNRVFNEKLGYCGAIPALADLERELDAEGRFEEFKKAFWEIYGQSWLDSRHKFRIIRDKVQKALVKIGYMSEEAAKAWIQESTANYSIAIEDFAARVQEYVEKTGERVVFLVDEIGQFISGDSQLMLNLQTMTEELGTRCKGKVWVIVTAQEDLDSMTEDMKETRNDFSKIQGRFGTRLSLSSVNVDEVIRERILKKNEVATKTLKALYVANETDIHNVVDFKGTIELKKANTPDEFAAVYPFLPYQFNLLGSVLNAIRLNSASGKNLSEGERSMLGAYKEAAKSIKDEEDGVLVPFYRFYDDLVKHLDHTHASVIQKAQENDRLNPARENDCFVINVLKTLFLLKYVDGVPLTLNNIQALMTTNIREKKADLKNRIDEALRLLMKELLVQQIQDTYEFLTDEEQDINRRIEERNIQNSDVIAAVTDMVYDRIYNVTRYKVPKHGGRYTFPFNQAVDNRPKKSVQNSEIGIRLISPIYMGVSGVKVDDGGMSVLSVQNHEAIFVLPDDKMNYIKNLRNALKIEDYIRNVADPKKGKSTTIRSTKIQEAAQAKETALSSLREAIGEASIFVNGNKITDITAHDASIRMNEALGRLVDNYYYKLQYMQAPKDDVDIRELFKKDNQVKLQLGEDGEPNALALKEVKEVISLSTGAHNMISVKSIIDMFMKSPYGYTESDVRYLIAKLFKDGDLSVTVDKEPITMFNRSADDLGLYFTNRKYFEKMLLMVKDVIPKAKIKACKDVIHELFLVTESTDDAEKLMYNFIDKASTLLENCRDMITEHDKIAVQYPDYGFPGEKVLNDAVKELTALVAIKDTVVFFNKISESKDNLISLAEELHPVKTFYGSDSQKTIFCDSGLRALKYYDNSKEHIVDANLEKTVESIRSIVKDKKPYKRIKDLPELYSKFMEIYTAILNEKFVPVKQIIDQDKQKVLDRLTGKSFESELKTAVIQDFMDLTTRAEDTNDISDMLGFKDKADSKCVTWLTQISQREAAEQKDEPEISIVREGDDPDKGTSGTKKSKKTKTILARTITSDWIIETEEELDKCLGELKKQIMSQMDAEYRINVTF